jgi:hypothetical protein
MGKRLTNRLETLFRAKTTRTISHWAIPYLTLLLCDPSPCDKIECRREDGKITTFHKVICVGFPSTLNAPLPVWAIPLQKATETDWR